ncbi:hypothetical protein EDD15DRAFT_873161 [Pisolithus albus]|nr:hypothetical protein EDD15DRAFT_873161 [Pisolithus albus]
MISITLSDDPFATLPTGTEIFTLSSSGNCSVEGYGSPLARVIRALRATTVEHVKEAKRTRISADIETTIGEFEKEMKGVQDIVRDPAQRTPEARRVLRSTDVLIISVCASSMRAVCDALRSTSSINHDFGSMDDGFEALKRGLDIENCSCGISTEPE